MRDVLPRHVSRILNASRCRCWVAVCIERVVLVALAVREQHVLLCTKRGSQIVHDPQRLFDAFRSALFDQVVRDSAACDEVPRLSACRRRKWLDDRVMTRRVLLLSASPEIIPAIAECACELRILEPTGLVRRTVPKTR